jgi:LysM repeat protein
MVLGRRHWKFLVLPLILMMLLTACERPLSSNDNEAAEATAVAETVDEESPEGDDDSAEVDSPADAAVDPDGETTEEQTQAEPEDEDTDPAGDGSQEAESDDPEAGGGTPDTAAEDADAEAADAEEASAEEVAIEETAGDEEAVEGEETAETGEEDSAASDETAESTTGAEATAEEAEASAESTSASTLPATHTVAPGENLYRIGLQYGMSWVTLAAYNNLPNANYIRLGQVLNIPGGTSPPPTTPPPSTPDEPGYTNYVVQPGDTLNSIGRKFGVSWVEIAEANGIVNPNLIYAGQVLKIPTNQPETPPSLTHTVQPGETLYRISLQYGVHWLAIAQANNIATPYVIYPGQVLTIPSG